MVWVWGQIYDDLPNQLKKKGMEGQGHWQEVSMEMMGIPGGFPKVDSLWSHRKGCWGGFLVGINIGEPY